MNGSQQLRPRSRRECDSVSKFLYSAPSVDSKQLFRSTRLRGARSSAAPASLLEELQTLKSRKSEPGLPKKHRRTTRDDVSVSFHLTRPQLSTNVYYWTSVRVFLRLAQNFMRDRRCIAFTKSDVLQ